MQDAYAGDVGDFGKFGLLRLISTDGVKIGVNWYRTIDSPSNIEGNGSLVNYLTNARITYCDISLAQALTDVVYGNRSIRGLEEKQLIENAIYFSEPVYPANQLNFSRSEWHMRAMHGLSNADIIFCDPDNGLLPPSISAKSKKTDKYILPDEIDDYYLSGKSVIFYNHRSRQKPSAYLHRFNKLKDHPALQNAAWAGVSYHRGNIRDYFFILQPYHTATVQGSLNRLLSDEWSKHFTKLDF